MLTFDEKRTHCSDYFDLVFSPGDPPAAPSCPPPGQTFNLVASPNNFAKIVLVFSKTGRDYQPPAPILCEIFLGMAWGNAKSEDERGEGEKLLGKTLLFRILQLKFSLFWHPRRRRSERGSGDLAWVRQTKKGAQERIPEPLFWGVI